MGRKTQRKIIVTPEILDKINPISKKIVERYLKNFDTKRSDKSVVVKRSDYQIFLSWVYLYADNKPITELKKYELMDFFDFGVNDLGWGSARFNSFHSSMNTLFTFIENFYDEEFPDFRNNMAKIEKMVKQPVREKTVLTDEQVQSLIDHIKATEKNNQKLVYLLLSIGSGERISEVLQMTTDLIDENNLAFGDTFLKTTRKIRTKGFGKKGEPKFRYIHKDLFWDEYTKWLSEREEILLKKGKDHNYIFLKSNGDPATSEVLGYWTKQWSDFLTNDDKTNPKHEEVFIYPHCFRHYFTSYLLRKGVTKDTVIALQNWKSGYAMLELYNDNEEDEGFIPDLDKLKEAF